VDGQTVEAAERDAPRLIGSLREALLRESCRPGAVRRVSIPKPGGGRRDLGIPNVVDRVAQQAVLQVLEPIFEPTFHPSSHGFRRDRGAPTAIAEAKAHLETGRQTVVDIDLSKVFDRVDHQRLMDRLARKVSDSRVLALVRRWLTAGVVMPDGVRIETHEGAPQGGPLSPLLSNIVLDELDWELARRGHRFVRYADDCNIFVRSGRAGQRVMASIRDFLERRMRLKVNAEKSAVRKPWAAHFLGFPLFIPTHARGSKDYRDAFGQSGETAQGDCARHDASQLGEVAQRLHEGPEPLPERMDGAFSAVHRRGRQGTWGDRRPCPSPPQGDHHPSEEAPPLPAPAFAGQGGHPTGRSRGGVQPQRQMVPFEPCGHDASLSAVLVPGADDFAQSPMDRAQPREGVRATCVRFLTHQAKEPDARPACPVL
jgi:group II intron reverse transcriptase/maturase